MSKREFELSAGTSNKFWHIELDGKSYKTRYGRIGTNGQSTSKELATPDKAKSAVEKLVDQKVAKGYIEKTSKKTTAKKATTKKVAKKAKKKKSAAKPVPQATTALKDARLLVFDDGKSHKFWAIRQRGSAHTVNYGKTGTVGQTKSKPFADRKAAKASCEKLIADKLAKGYVELGADGEPLARAALPAKPTKPMDAESAMALIASKDSADGVVCTESLDFRGAPMKNQSWSRPTKRKKAKRVELPSHLRALGVNLDGSSWLTQIPPGWNVVELDVSDCSKLSEIGAGLKCYQLDASSTALEILPEDISVQYKLDLSDCTKLTTLPTGLKVTSLVLANCTALTSLPEGLDVAFLDVRGCTQLKQFPKKGNIRVGNLIANGCTRLKQIPAWVKTLSQLSVEDCPDLKRLPADLSVSSWLDVAGSGLSNLPTAVRTAPIRWRGVPVDYRIAFQPNKLKGKEVLAEENAERRRVMLQRMGFERFIKEVDAETLDTDRDPGGERRLLRVRIQDDEDLVCVSVNCPSTGRQYIIRVPPRTKTCHQAVAWTAGFDDPAQYKPIKET